LQRRTTLLPQCGHILETDGIYQVIGNDEGLTPCRIAATHTKTGHRHGIDTGGTAGIDRRVFLRCTECRQLELQQVLEQLGMADAGMVLEKITASIGLEAQGATSFAGTIDITVLHARLRKRLLVRPRGSNVLTQVQGHADSPLIASAAWATSE